MTNATFAWPGFGLRAQPDTTNYRPRCVTGCGRRTRSLLIPTCGDTACEAIDSSYEHNAKRRDDQ